MFKTKVSIQTTSLISRKSNCNALGSARNANVSLPCPSHPNFLIQHLCLQPTCTQNTSFCSECLFDPQQQQHIARHREHVIGWVEFIALCRRMSVSGRMGDAGADKDVIALVLQTQIHQQQFKTHMRQQEQLINTDFDRIIEKLTNDVNKLKQDLMKQYKLYQNELVELGGVVEKMVQEFYHNKGESKDYSNDFDSFIKEIQIIQEQVQSQEAKVLRQSFQQNTQTAQPITFNLKRLMQNIVPLLSRANSTFQKNIINSDTPDNQSCVSGLSLFSSYQMKNTENTVLMDLIGEYRTLIDNRPQYKNQGIAQQVFNEANEATTKIYHQLSETLQNFIKPQFKSVLANLKYQNKENNQQPPEPCRTSRTFNSPARAQQIREQTMSPFKKQFNDKSSVIIDSYLKQQHTNQLKQIKAQSQFIKTDDDDQREIFTKQNSTNQVNQCQLEIATSEQEFPNFTSLDHKRSIQTSHKGGINCILLVDEDYLATGSNDKTVKVWSTRDYDLHREIQFKSDVTALCAISRPDGSTMIVVGLYRALCLLNQGFEVVRHFESQPSYIDKGSLLSTTYQLPKVTLNLLDAVQPSTPTTMSVVQQTVHSGQINCILPLPDGQTVLSCAQGDNKLVQWNLIDVQHIPKKYFEHRDSVTCLSNVNGQLQVASAGKDRNIKLFTLIYHDKDFKGGSLDKLQLQLTIQDAHQTEITALNSTPQPSLILSMSSTGELKMWDSNDGSLIRLVKNQSGWGYKILVMYQTVIPNTNTTENQYQPKTNRNLGSPLRKQVQKPSLPPQYVQQLKKSQIMTFSFDGTMKLFNCDQFITENQQGNYSAQFSVQTKSLLDCHPFGGALLIKDPVTDKLEIITSGNKNDNNLQIYGLKEL